MTSRATILNQNEEEPIASGLTININTTAIATLLSKLIPDLNSSATKTTANMTSARTVGRLNPASAAYINPAANASDAENTIRF